LPISSALPIDHSVNCNFALIATPAPLDCDAYGGFDLGEQLYNNGGSLSKVSWREVGANALGGAVAGALAVATAGTLLVENAVVGDIAAGGTANVVGGRGAIRRDNAKFAKYNNALANQITRATVTGSAAIHTTNGGISLWNWLMFSPPPPPPSPQYKVTVRILDYKPVDNQ
jgi:hypothetical protein